MANAITKLITWMTGNLVGKDEYGNRYYQSRSHKAKSHKVGDKRPKRWVIYAKHHLIKADDASLVPASHYNWLHYTSDEFPHDEANLKPWQKAHRPNLTGTSQAYRPQGHVYQGEKRPKATGDYQAWLP